MSMFWTAIALLGVLAGLVVLVPLRRAVRLAGEDAAADARRAQNLAAYRQQLAELEAARVGGALDDGQFAAARLELDRRVLDDTAAPAAVGARSGSGRPVLLACALAVPLLALGLYRHLGATPEIELAALIAQLEQEMPEAQRAELLSRLQPRLEAQGRKLKLSKPARDFLLDKGFDEAQGARPLRRAVERYVEDPLAEAILRGEIKGASIEVIKEEDKLGFRTKAEAAPTAA